MYRDEGIGRFVCHRILFLFNRTYMRKRRTSQRGVSLIEVLIVVAITAIMMAFAFPKLGAARDSATKRAARQELVAVFAATRAAALQKGKTATLTLTSTTATVTAQSGLAGNTVTIMGPINFSTSLKATVMAISGSATTVRYNARGLLTPTPNGNLMYQITTGSMKDTVCINPNGLIMPRGCAL